MAVRSSGSPPRAGTFWTGGTRQAVTAASTMYSGVGKSGSPAPNPITGRPAAFSAFALASTANVADSLMALIRAEILEPICPILASGLEAREHARGVVRWDRVEAVWFWSRYGARRGSFGW